MSKQSTQIVLILFKYQPFNNCFVCIETINLNPLNFIQTSTIRFAWSISKPSTQILGASFYVNHQICLVHFETINSNPWNFIVCQPSDSLGPFRNHQLKSLELHCMSTIRFAWSISKPSTQILGTSFYVNRQIRLVHFETINSNPWNFIVCQPSDSLGPFWNHQLKSLELHSMSTVRFAWSISKPSTGILGTFSMLTIIFAWSISKPSTQILWTSFKCQPSDCFVHIQTINMKVLWISLKFLLFDCWNHQLESFELNSIHSSQSFLAIEGFGFPLCTIYCRITTLNP